MKVKCGRHPEAAWLCPIIAVSWHQNFYCSVMNANFSSPTGVLLGITYWRLLVTSSWRLRSSERQFGI
ncbi:hypothetical protein J6590_034170 [Homalodisca vitripennis]|nr:hypothetical protein J6590_034170 [Homalodisca vitripennis]